MYYCEILEKNFLKGPCLFEKNGTIPGNQTCSQCSYYNENIIINPSSVTDPKKKTAKSKPSIKKTIKAKISVNFTKHQETKIIEQEPWRAEAVDILTNPMIHLFIDAKEQDSEMINKIRNPYFSYFFKFSQKKFNKDREKYKDDLTPLLKDLEKAIKQGLDDTDKYFQKIETIWNELKPVNAIDLKSKLTYAATWYLAFRQQSEGRPRGAQVKKQLEKICKMAATLSDFLMHKAHDETLFLLDVWEKIYNYQDDIHKIHMKALVELRTFPTDPGGPHPWETDGWEAYFKMIADIYKEGTGIKVGRDNDRESGKPKKAYKSVLNFFRLCLNPINPRKNLSNSAIDSTIKNYLEPTQN